MNNPRFLSRAFFAAAAALALLAAPAPRAHAQHTQLLAEGLDKPVDFQPDPTSKSRFYVVEQTGNIRVIEDGKLLEKPFLTVPADKINARGWEQGLLGLAFDPHFAQNKRFYVDYTNKKGDTHISRFTASDAYTCDPATEEVLLEIDQPFPNHNGGCVRFGPDGMLYIGMGDGGSAGDPRKNAQNLGSLLGKLLRIDVTSKPEDGRKYVIPKDNPFVKTDGAKPEIWAYGLRNP
ncbi:MAG TPA: PQQ-dependent sugar dehydrogenase, partial [Phycisphaerales bacterium]|nr:PQQ-dependent sugar dehydrogenase [Phycisphaerales bacterium]